jgi:hypothetical protein
MNRGTKRQLSGPLVQYLREVDWSAEQRRVAEGLFAEPSSSSVRAWALARPWPLACGAAVMVAAVVLLVWSGGKPASGALVTRQGREFPGLATASQPSRVDFADGSHVEIEPHTRLVALAATGTDMSLLLEEGQVRVSVQPGGPRHWRVETKFGAVEVVGTVFSVSRTSSGFDVQVERGAVVVRSPHLREGALRLTAGHGVSIVATEPRPEPPGDTVDVRDLPEVSPDVATSRPNGERPQLPGLERARAEADAARASGDLVRAAGLYAALHADLVAEDPSDTRLPFVRYAWAATEQDRGLVRQALGHFNAVLSGGASNSLRQDAWLRTVQCHLALGERSRAELARERYEAEFRAGRHREAMRRLLEGDPPR